MPGLVSHSCVGLGALSKPTPNRSLGGGWAPPPASSAACEERIKGRIWEQPHYNTREGAVLLMNGVVVSHSAQELSVLLRTALDERDRENREAGAEEWGLG